MFHSIAGRAVCFLFEIETLNNLCEVLAAQDSNASIDFNT